MPSRGTTASGILPDGRGLFGGRDRLHRGHARLLARRADRRGFERRRGAYPAGLRRLHGRHRVPRPFVRQRDGTRVHAGRRRLGRFGLQRDRFRRLGLARARIGRLRIPRRSVLRLGLDDGDRLDRGDALRRQVAGRLRGRRDRDHDTERHRPAQRRPDDDPSPPLPQPSVPRARPRPDAAQRAVPDRHLHEAIGDLGQQQGEGQPHGEQLDLAHADVDAGAGDDEDRPVPQVDRVGAQADRPQRRDAQRPPQPSSRQHCRRDHDHRQSRHQGEPAQVQQRLERVERDHDAGQPAQRRQSGDVE